MDISIIIINFNSSTFTIGCIESIHRHTKTVSFEIIVVDNNSSSKDLLILETYLENSSVKLIKSKVNLGFGGGNHLGYQFASGKHYAFINNDVELTENSLLKLLQYSNAHPDIGVLGLHQVNAEQKQFRYSYRQFIGFNYHFFNQKKPQAYYGRLTNSDLSKPFEVDIVSGAFMFFKKVAYEKAGGFDPNIFLFYEEMDVCLRLKKAGYKTVFYPESTFIHFMGKSSTNVKIRAEFTISYLYVIQKNFTYSYFCAMRLMLLLKYGFKSILKPKKYYAPFKILLRGGNSLVYSMKP
ncbi:glycosyltransferase family 2 protein [Subsaximicrobium wynnwilliamsii]|uniref:Glycosyltransferase family 2 protein n=1 Tax=Subsaximicrobium wynnwilliamsii TaxID=291179 RepID=A0A5C6ZK99_9FLAO|nr:glycosyltransferase family 2 protein [Subsaximicrobium wynnwilliamsii]TXD84963.1 glycosyltransferase family 2 protein [Subsaximicrobium wynnwilliamsii]TXD90634.1 glycosyltransferase family 2 protein [Subsaximicrobium wynnwilliamsii]TXE05108.1 glycosyltransferase family 2 protein [Subsaximicrobium wynnwilliamsii]